MKYNLSYIVIMLVTSVLFFTACSDKYMEDMNTDPRRLPLLTPMPNLLLHSCKLMATWVWSRSIATISTHSINS